ncbi:hypothetical protein [Streptomyces sp. NPDC101455]|uniref:hypothetical protein n=1 Tax=Streptomyces sp. NPDC101455 TaxID=3366142 RepID=UPI0038023CFD
MTGADVLLLSDGPHDPDVTRLVIYEVPAARDLTRRQNNGEACVWCNAEDGLEPLGGASGWRPHGCPPCLQLRLEYLHAYTVWRRHVQDCELCRTVWCPDGWRPFLAHQIAYSLISTPGPKADPVFCACGCAVPLASRRLRPYVETPLSGPRYSHTGPCTDPGVLASVDEGPRR